MATVVRIRRSGGQVVQWCSIYIGRRCYLGGWALAASKWANPFKLGVDGHSSEEILAKYEQYVRSSDLYNQLEELRGETLGCWCSGKSPCHGDILVKLLNERCPPAPPQATHIFEVVD